ncbi:MAG TPA: hypothetical protein VFI02_22025 [Armatimonadota bacterium]|nr:hypothetical protein [Armatimonadota bacterium]
MREPPTSKRREGLSLRQFTEIFGPFVQSLGISVERPEVQVERSSECQRRRWRRAAGSVKTSSASGGNRK